MVETFDNTNLESLAKVGQDTITLVKTLNSILLLKAPLIDDVFMRSDYLLRLMNLFFERHSNNLLHNHFRDALVAIISNLNTDIFLYVRAADQVFESKLIQSFTRLSLAAVRLAEKSQQAKLGTCFRGYNYPQIVKIGEALLQVYKQKNYVGKEVDDYFCTEDWAELMTEYVRPTLAVFDKRLCQVDPRAFLEKKATLSDFADQSSDHLDGLLMAESPPMSPTFNPQDDFNEHAIFIDPKYLDSNLFQIPIQHDIEDLLREVND
jgi:hypothetical protein